ncbi:MAG: hypothetical protein KDE51_04570, partial [Anaerolineales bacterium]|nr:hypothetical protein [Anaerolineales bacterium]
MIACVTVPYFAAAVERRDRTALAETPLVIGGEPWETRPVYAFSEEAAVQGVFPRMSLRRAHLLSPQARFLPANQRHYRHAAAEVLDVLSEFTPLIQPDPLWLPDEVPQRPRTEPEQQLPARYFIDLEQLSWAQTLRLSQEIGRTVRTTTRLSPAIGIATDAFTAAIAATSTRPHHLLPVAEMDTQRFITSKPLTFLPLEQETLRRLKLLGLRTVGEFMALPLGLL